MHSTRFAVFYLFRFDRKLLNENERRRKIFLAVSIGTESATENSKRNNIMRELKLKHGEAICFILKTEIK